MGEGGQEQIISDGRDAGPFRKMATSVGQMVWAIPKGTPILLLGSTLWVESVLRIARVKAKGLPTVVRGGPPIRPSSRGRQNLPMVLVFDK